MASARICAGSALAVAGRANTATTFGLNSSALNSANATQPMRRALSDAAVAQDALPAASASGSCGEIETRDRLTTGHMRQYRCGETGCATYRPWQRIIERRRSSRGPGIGAVRGAAYEATIG
jgi:hypothetical protein